MRAGAAQAGCGVELTGAAGIARTSGCSTRGTSTTRSINTARSTTVRGGYTTVNFERAIDAKH